MRWKVLCNECSSLEINASICWIMARAWAMGKGQKGLAAWDQSSAWILWNKKYCYRPYQLGDPVNILISVCWVKFCYGNNWLYQTILKTTSSWFQVSSSWVFNFNGWTDFGVMYNSTIGLIFSTVWMHYFFLLVLQVWFIIKK